jgi:hypothetical protein
MKTCKNCGLHYCNECVSDNYADCINSFNTPFWIPKPYKERPISLIFLVLALIISLYFVLIPIRSTFKNEKKHQQALKERATRARKDSIFQAFILGWQKGSAVTLEQITIHGNNPKAEILINNQYSLDTNEFNKEIR